MSLARLALRLAVYEALNPFASITAGPSPTIAGKRVYDSRIDPLQEGTDLDSIEGQPLLIVYTEQDFSTPYGTAKYPPDEQVVHLVVEMMIATKGVLTVDNPNGTSTDYGTIDAPITERQHEALLDLLEAQVRRVLDRRSRAPSSALLNAVAMEVHRIESVPQRADDRGTRLAARTLTLTIKVNKEIWPPIPVSPPATGLDLLPLPLATVAKALDPASTGGLLCASLALRLQGIAPAPLVPLDGIGFTTPAGDNPPIASLVPIAT